MRFIHDAFIIKEACRKLAKLPDSLKSKDEIVVARVEVLELEASAIEARENKLKEELQSSLENVWDLESLVKEYEIKAV